MARSVKAIAKWINENTNNKAKLEKSYTNTDRTPRGYRYITHVGKGRNGFRLIVTNKDDKLIYKHDTSETYRSNKEIEDWIEEGMRDTTGGFGTYSHA